MTKETAIKLFNEKKIRTLWDDEQEKWCFSVVDVVSFVAEVGILTIIKSIKK